MIDVGLIGFGLAGRAFHAPVIRAVPGLRLTAILQRSSNEAAEQYSDVRIVRSLDELLSIESLRLIIIATPNETHFSFAKQCLAAGRDVVVDKPFTTTFAEATELANFAQRSGRLLTVYQNRRFDSDFQAIIQLVSGGALGRIVRFETNYDRFRPQLRLGPWREKRGPGTGILFDLGPHLIDHAFVLLGLPEAIAADVRMERDDAVTDDAFDIFLRYPGGTRAVLRSTMLAASPRPRFAIHGTRGGYSKHSFDPQEANLRRGYIPQDKPWGAEPEENWGVLTLHDGTNVTERRIPSGTGDYRDFYANVRDAILGKGALAVKPQHALNVMWALELSRKSSEQGRTISWAEAAAL
jgi:scyllo-inositol 2-dehydrogenase (NADP+)